VFDRVCCVGQLDEALANYRKEIAIPALRW
jgi:hypothetical protein